MSGFFSAFKGGSSGDVKSNRLTVATTGGKVDEVVNALISSSYDSDEKVRAAMDVALFDLGRRQPDLLLSAIGDFLTRQKPSQEHRIQLLKIMLQVVELKRDEFNELLGPGLIDVAMADMTRDKDVVPDLQGAASLLLVSLGMRYPKILVEELMKRFPPGSLPHYFVMKTLGDFAAANAPAMVPQLREVFARVIPVLASVSKFENMKWVFAHSIHHFCEAILGSATSAEDLASFSSEAFPAYEVMFSNWLQSKESRVRLACIRAIGSLCATMAREPFEVQLPKVLPVVLRLLQKEKDVLPLIQGLFLILDTSVREDSPALEPLLAQVYASLHPLVCAFLTQAELQAAAGGSTAAAAASTGAFKCANELLRCFEVVCRRFSDQTLGFLLQRLDSKDSSARAGTLRVLRHIASRLDEQMSDKRALLVSGIKPLATTESVRRVRRALAECIMAMSSYPYLNLEGGHVLIEFVVRIAATPEAEIAAFDAAERRRDKSVLADDPVSPKELRNMAESMLHLWTTSTGVLMHDCLWPRLFEMILPMQYEPASAALYKTLGAIGAAKREHQVASFQIDWEKEVNLPRQPSVCARLLVQLNQPARRGNIGLQVLELLRALGPLVHANPQVAALWDVTLPKMAGYLTANSGSAEWQQPAWEDLTMRLMLETIKAAADEEFTSALIDALSQQYDLYAPHPELKRAALRMTGMLLQHVQRKELMRTVIDRMFAGTDHASAPQRQGLAQGYGFASVVHLDPVLEKLQERAKSLLPQKSTGLLSGLMSSKPAVGSAFREPFALSTVLAFGYASAYAPVNLLPARVELHILNHMRYFTEHCKSSIAKEVMARSVEMIGKAMNVQHLGKRVTLAQRDELLGLLLSFLRAFQMPSPKSPSKSADPGAEPGGPEANLLVVELSLQAATALAYLEPRASVEVDEPLLEVAVSFYALDAGPDDQQLAVQAALNGLLEAILSMDPNAACLLRLFTIIRPYACSPAALQRQRAVTSVLLLLKRFVDLKGREPPEGKKQDKLFANMNVALSMLLPRCTDPLPAVRRLAIEAVQMSLYINHVLRVSVDTPGYLLQPPETLRPLSGFRDRLTQPCELPAQFAVMTELVATVSPLLSIDENQELLASLLSTLTDPEDSSSAGACVVVNGLVKLRGKELGSKVQSLVAGFLGALAGITNDQTRNGTLHSLRSLATAHPVLVIDELLAAPLPHSTHVIQSLQVLARDKDLVLRMINHFTNIINNSQVIEEKPDPKNRQKTVNVQSPKAMSTTAALGEIMLVAELEAVVKEHFYLLCSSLLLRFGTAVDFADAREQAVTAWRSFLSCSRIEQLTAATDADDNWSRLSSPAYPEAITAIARAACVARPDDRNGVFQFLLPYLRSNFMGQRVVTITMFAAMLPLVGDDKTLLQSVVNSLLSSLADPVVKRQALCGLGFIGDVGPAEANKYAPTVLDALMCYLDDQDESLAASAMAGLARIFAFVDESRVAPTLVNTCLRLKPAFDKPSNDMRSTSIQLFGSLHRFGSGSAAHVFFEQLHSFLPSLLVHLNEPCDAVQKSCKRALRDLAPLFGSEELTAFLVGGSWLDVNRELAYDEFIHALSKHLLSAFPDRVNYYIMTCCDAYFKSQWTVVRANAATIVGALLGNLSSEQRQNMVLNPIPAVSALLNLLKERDPVVRLKVTNALALLHHY